ncbi:hypothetical protein O181_003668 [Austropuccinia psidii MF-1]|uniref:Uncharacterized protein n=1 Tax=Austropuccinia psidii MF-1 TaxID=1389203 RepID=A0A9Q3BEV4_9BASI|nr:hypothetical protein [Austropuccinia psidii MF-1]
MQNNGTELPPISVIQPLSPQTSNGYDRTGQPSFQDFGAHLLTERHIGHCHKCTGFGWPTEANSRDPPYSYSPNGVQVHGIHMALPFKFRSHSTIMFHFPSTSREHAIYADYPKHNPRNQS